MAFRLIKNVNGVNGVNAGQTATVKFPLGERYLGLDFEFTNNGAPDYSKAKEIRLSMGGSVVQKLTIPELIALYEENLNSANPGHVPVFFAEPSRSTIIDNEITAWDTAGERDFELQVDFDAAAVNPTVRIKSTTDRDGLTDSVTGAKIKQLLRRLPLYNNPPAGWFDITNIPNDSPITAIRFNTTDTPTPGDILAYEVIVGGEKVAEGTWQENKNELEAAGYDATKFVLPLIFARDHRVSSALDCRIKDAKGNVIGLKPLVVRVQMASAKGIKYITDQVRFGF